jgi:hypothetical protein
MELRARAAKPRLILEHGGRQRIRDTSLSTDAGSEFAAPSLTRDASGESTAHG